MATITHNGKSHSHVRRAFAYPIVLLWVPPAILTATWAVLAYVLFAVIGFDALQ